MTTAPKLEPCPFCGGKHIESVSKTKTGKDIHACMTCGAEAPNWNRRAAPSAGLREALEKISAMQWQDRSTVSELNAWPAFQKANARAVEIFKIADAALTLSKEGGQ